MNLEIDTQSNIPAYLQICHQLRDQILQGDIPTGTQLPPERTLASALGVSRSTIVNAYGELKAEGLATGYVGRGTIVETPPTHLGSHPIAWPVHLSALGHRLTQYPHTADLPALRLSGRPDVVSFALGLPDTDLIPPDRLAVAWQAIVERFGPTAINMCPPQGLPAVREAIARRMERRGTTVAPEHIIVVNGSQHGLDLLLRLLVEPGDTILSEVPTYFGALRCFQTWGARIIGVPVDERGMDVARVESLLARYHPKFIYTVPTYQNPTGATMSLERRQRLLALAQQYQVPIVEDDPFSDLYFDDPPPPPIKALDRHGHVLYLSTFSKSLAPGLRVGWLAAARPIVQHAALLNQITELQPNTIGQHLVVEFARRGWLEDQIVQARAAYKERCAAMDATLKRRRAPGLRWTSPTGGMFLWLHLPEAITARELLEESARQGAIFLPGDLMHLSDGHSNTCRLNFSIPDPPAIERGITAMMTALKKLLDRPDETGRTRAMTDTIV
ncbi:MAG TPA: PLP-dependent aminotransferase family protein [Chloroflexi bacterium]|nr:PLP-dependent aminotransferase family protein [Chloroflexota bacterium]